MIAKTSDRESRGWSLARRLTYWVASCVGILLVVEMALAVWFVRDTLRRELDGLILEEAAELRVGMLEGPLDEQRLTQLATKLDLEHPEVRLSLRAWREPLDEPWVLAGASPEIPWASLAESSQGGEPALGPLYRMRSDSFTARIGSSDGREVEEQIRIEVLIDGSQRAASLEKAAAFFMLIATLGGGVTVLAGFIFAKRMARTLEKVAASAALAQSQDQGETAIPDRAPDEIRKVAQAFQESIEQIRADHSRNVLLTAGLAHELRSPLQNLISEAEVGLLKERDGPEYRRLVRFQLEELRRLALVVDNLITLTALRDRENLPRGETFDLAAEIRIRLSHEEEEAARRGVTIEILERGDCGITGDREALVLMVRNLVGNAVRWTSENTTVQLVIDGHERALTLTMEDQGPGVQAHERDAIFNAFYQGKSPRKMRTGYGLGLALARTAARSEGGDISVGSTALGGARFVVALPRVTNDSSAFG